VTCDCSDSGVLLRSLASVGAAHDRFSSMSVSRLSLDLLTRSQGGLRQGQHLAMDLGGGLHARPLSDW
jgi:hypothetical protein